MITTLSRNEETNADFDSWEFPGGFGSRIHGQIGDHGVHSLLQLSMSMVLQRTASSPYLSMSGDSAVRQAKRLKGRNKEGSMSLCY